MLAVAWAVLHVAPWTDYQIVDTPVYQRYGEADDRRPGALPGLPARVSAGGSAGIPAPALGPSDDYRTLFEILMLACGMGIVALVAATLARVGVTLDESCTRTSPSRRSLRSRSEASS